MTETSLLKAAMDRRNLPKKALSRLRDFIDYSWALRVYKGFAQVSANHALIYEEKLGIPRSELRPDLWPPEQKQTQNHCQLTNQES